MDTLNNLHSQSIEQNNEGVVRSFCNGRHCRQNSYWTCLGHCKDFTKFALYLIVLLFWRNNRDMNEMLL